VVALVAAGGAGGAAHEAERLLLVALQLRATGRDAVADEVPLSPYLSLPCPAPTRGQAHAALRRLADALGFADGAALFRAHFAALLAAAAAEPGAWTKHSPRRLLLDALVREAAPAVVAEHLPAVLATVRAAAAPALDVEVRLGCVLPSVRLPCVPLTRAQRAVAARVHCPAARGRGRAAGRVRRGLAHGAAAEHRVAGGAGGGGGAGAGGAVSADPVRGGRGRPGRLPCCAPLPVHAACHRC
jgi:hypothetical protein